MANIVVVGVQWGDEGKGKIVDLLTEHADVVARFQGGHNAGHTVVTGEDEFVLHLIPSGILHPGKTCVIGNGVVVDPEALIQEIDGLRQRGVAVGENLVVSDNAHLIMPFHVAIDQGSESARGRQKIGTTGRGIGPCYVDKMARRGLRTGDLLRPGLFRERLERQIRVANVLLEHLYGADPMDADAVYETYMGHAEVLRPFIQDTTALLAGALKEGRHVLLEGAQGALLDIDHGTYPFVTSSSPTAGGACTGLGFGPTRISGVLGIVKAYTTRVGSGPFPTEQENEIGETLRSRGGEFGATTGRARRCGWFDAVTARYSAHINGLTGLAITKLDVLDEFEEIRVCTGYRLNGRELKSFPHDAGEVEAVEPVYETLPGWRRSTVGVRRFDDLPENARRYIEFLEAQVGVPADLVSTGQKRDEIIIRRNPFETYGRPN